MREPRAPLILVSGEGDARMTGCQLNPDENQTALELQDKGKATLTNCGVGSPAQSDQRTSGGHHINPLELTKIAMAFPVAIEAFKSLLH